MVFYLILFFITISCDSRRSLISLMYESLYNILVTNRVRMNTKFVIFVIIGSLLVAAIYNSSTRLAFAESLTSCTNLNKTKVHCTLIQEGSYPLGSDCTKNPDGTYSCTQDQDQDNRDDGLSDRPDSNDSNDNND